MKILLVELNIVRYQIILLFRCLWKWGRVIEVTIKIFSLLVVSHLGMAIDNYVFDKMVACPLLPRVFAWGRLNIKPVTSFVHRSSTRVIQADIGTIDVRCR